MELAKIAKKNEGEKLNNFDDLSISTTSMRTWKVGLGKSKWDKSIPHNSTDLDNSDKRNKFKSLDECLNTSITSIRT